MNTEELRARFEVIAATEFTNPVDNVFSFGKYEPGKYDYAGVQSAWVCYEQCAKDMQGENERLRDKLLELSKWPQLTAGGDTWQSVLGEVLYNMATEEPNNG